MNLPPFFTNSPEMCKTLAIGLFAGVLLDTPKGTSRPVIGSIAAVAVRTFHYYCGWGATIGACAGFIAIAIANQQERDTKKSPLFGAVIWGVIGYGVERIARALLPIVYQRIARV